LFLLLLIQVLQWVKDVRLEILAESLALPILFESRRKKMQRFLDLKTFNIENCWLSWLRQFIEQQWESGADNRGLIGLPVWIDRQTGQGTFQRFSWSNEFHEDCLVMIPKPQATPQIKKSGKRSSKKT